MKKLVVIGVFAILVLSLTLVVADNDNGNDNQGNECSAEQDCIDKGKCDAGLECTCHNNKCYQGYATNDDEDDEFCGTSTLGACQTNADCKTGGCSGQVCENSSESTVTTCEFTECYRAAKYNKVCACVNNKCKWANPYGEDENKYCGWIKCPNAYYDEELKRCACGKLNQTRIKEIIQERNRIRFEERTGQECPENCTCTGVVMKCILEDGTREMTVYAGNSGNIIIQVKGINATTTVTLYHHNGSIYGVFRNNETKQIIDPEQVRERIRERIKQRTCECDDIELDEDALYQVQTKKKARLFYLIPVREKIKAQVDAETGQIIKIRNPWWGFLAKDVVEEETE